ncbi:hydroxylysine kinase-like [Babylonia areolata]|uniref:hydroxylysine kinase-like n=1 Tax=Babylonia areolata TaxID=304850 RepID=UPI003FD3D9B0
MSRGNRPTETSADVIQALADCYDLKARQVTDLVSYSSRNFAVEVEPQYSGKCIGDEAVQAGADAENCTERTAQKESSQKLVLKIFNSALCTERTLPKTRQQVRCSQFLRQRGFKCPLVIRTCHGEMFGCAASQSHTLLMTMLQGQQLGADQSRISSRVLFEVGALLACMHLTLKECDHRHLETDPCNPWALENMHLLLDYLHCIQDKDERLMLERIITKFHQISHDKLPKMEKGVIHGDFHDYNLIVDWEAADFRADDNTPPPQSPSQPPYFLEDARRSGILQKYGIIDFEEMSVSYPALELSRLIADMMIDCHQVALLDIGGHVLAGYTSVDSTPVEQFGICLFDTALACLAQYIVLSTSDYQGQEESNDYCLLGTEDSRAVLGRMVKVDSAEVCSAWGKVLTAYGFDSPFIV